MAGDELTLLTPEALLGGLPARRASTLLFAIESRTAHFLAQSQQALIRFPTEKTAEARERDFLTALAQGRDLPVQPTIQQLERFAPEWADLVPTEPGSRAALARILGQKYRFTYRDVPRLRQALGLDDEAVRQSYQRFYGTSLDALFVPEVGWHERLRWFWAELTRRLESLPPFWMVFVLTLTETVGASILALPIALAGISPLVGLAFLLVLGLVNVVTIGAMAETFARTGSIRYGGAFFGRLVAEYLGRAGSLLLTSMLLLLNFVSLIAYYLGIAEALAGASALPKALWAVLPFVIALAMLRRQSLNATVASALLAGVVNVGLLLTLTLLALPHVQSEYLLRLPVVDGQGFDSSVLSLVFGICLIAFFGHTTIGNCAAIVLHRDPSGRSLIRGAMAAMLVVIVLNGFWVIAVNGTLPAAALLGQPGTALAPLAAAVGPAILLLGAVYVVLGMGVASLHFSLALFNQVSEWLPPPAASPLQPIVGLAGRLRTVATQRNSRFLLCAAPIAAVFLTVEWLLWTGQESFAGTLSFIGTIGAALLAGTFPMLLLAASRRRGEYAPGAVVRWFGRPIVVGGVYLLFLLSIVLHGTVIWNDPLQRLAALLVATLMLGVTIAAIRRGAFRPRTVVELRVDRTTGRAFFSLIAGGTPLSTDLWLHYSDDEQHLVAASGEVPAFAALQALTVQLPATPTYDLRVWAHAVTRTDRSEALPIYLELLHGAETQRIDVDEAGGQALLRLHGAGGRLRIHVGATNRPP